MVRTLASEIKEKQGQSISLQGWLNNVRLMGKVAFLILRDASGFVQVVVEDKKELEKIRLLQPGSILRIEGSVASSPSSEKFEIVSPKITVDNAIDHIPEVEYYRTDIPSDLDVILDHRAIALRNRKIALVFKVQAELVHAFSLFMHDEEKAVQYFAPNIIGTSSEGGAEFFDVDYFGYSACLAQSSQLYKQMLVGVYEKVFAIQPFFRAEPSHTTRHLSEGKQLEFEMGFFERWEEIMDILERCMKFTLRVLTKRMKEELTAFAFHLPIAPDKTPIPRISFEKAQNLYFERTGIDERSEPDLSPAAERELCQWALETSGTDFVFITHWCREKRPFYSYPSEENPLLTNTFDLLCRGVEISSGGQRRHMLSSMREGIVEKGMDPEYFSDYLSIFLSGMPPHGGFGLGLERLTMTFLGLKNIREASLFPSDTKRIAGNRLRAKMFFGEENIRNEIIRQLKDQNIPFTHLEHEKASTSEDSARVRKTALDTGIKALILKGKSSKKNYQFNIPGHLKLDMSAVKQIVGEKCEFENPERIKERFGLQIGGVPPFGHLLNIENYYDEKIEKQGEISFNCGFKTESIVMKAKDLFTLVDPKIGSFTKD